MPKNLLQREARWWKKLSGLDFAIEYCPEGKNPANRLFRHLDYIKSDENKQVMYIVGYVTRNSMKEERTQNTAKNMQALDSTKVVSKPNQVLESQLTTDKNLQSTIQNAQHDNGNIAMNFSVKESEGIINCPFLSKRRQTLTYKWQAVKRVQEQL